MRNADELAVPRTLPSKQNPLLNDPPNYEELVEARRLGQTNLGGGSHNNEPFNYVHLRVQLPKPLIDQELFGAQTPEAYFLMRRSKDGFVSATGMFKASFPWARKTEEETEKQYVKLHFANTSKDETAGNLWVDPLDALTLAEDYGIKPWVEALLDNETVALSDSRKHSSATATSPPLFFRAAEMQSASTHSPAPRRRSTRSMSPGKRVMTPRKSRASKAATAQTPLKKQIAPVLEVKELEEVTTITATEETVLSAAVLPDGPSATTPVKKQTVKVEVDEAVETNGDIEVKSTHLKVELPEAVGEPPSTQSTEEMLAKAREMVEDARKLEGQSATPTKRKADELGEEEEEGDGEDDEEGDTTEQLEEPKSKRTKVLENQLKKEKVKTRALLGLSATLAIGALLPYVL